jgi:hypothetical protein
VAFGAPVSVEFDAPATTWSNEIMVPPALAVTAPPALETATIPTSGDLTFTWTAAGSEAMVIRMFGVGDCVIEDDGSFAVPASFLANVPNGPGAMVIIAIADGEASFNGRTVLTLGGSGRYWDTFK